MSNYTNILAYHALSAIKDKWTDQILWHLYKNPKRFSELKECLPGISKNILSAKLRKLSQNHLIVRNVIPDTPVKIEYSLSEFALSLKPIFSSIYLWEQKYGKNHNETINEEHIKPISFTLRILEKKWKVGILNCIRYDKKRIGELHKQLFPVSKKMLIEHLKEMENDGLIIKNTYNEVPPRVEYSLTEAGLALIPILDMFDEWGTQFEKYNETKKFTTV